VVDEGAFAQLDLCLCDARSLYDDLAEARKDACSAAGDGCDTGTPAGRLSRVAGRCVSATDGRWSPRTRSTARPSNFNRTKK
jgi:hypothetical protein